MKWIIRAIDNHYTVCSMTLAAAFGVAIVIWGERYGGRTVIDDVLKGNRSAVYGTFATIFGSLLGFVITAVSIVLGFSTSERLAIVRQSKHYPALWRSFTHTIRILGLTTVVSVVALIVDRDSKPVRPLSYAEMAVGFLSILFLCRSIWALERVIDVVAHQPATSKSSKALLAGLSVAGASASKRPPAGLQSAEGEQTRTAQLVRPAEPGSGNPVRW
jgi:hypothetical protein